jgi:hypothetical protein
MKNKKIKEEKIKEIKRRDKEKIKNEILLV